MHAFSTNMIEAVESRRMFANISIVGTPGDDNISVTANNLYVTVTINGTSQNYTAVRSIVISGGTGNDLINVDHTLQIGAAISGNSGNDTIYGSGANDTITGNNGNDLIQGYEGDDLIYGGDGADAIDGGDGDDSVYATDASTNSDGDVDTIFQFYYNTGNDDFHFNANEGDTVRHSVLS